MISEILKTVKLLTHKFTKWYIYYVTSLENTIGFFTNLTLSFFICVRQRTTYLGHILKTMSNLVTGKNKKANMKRFLIVKKLMFEVLQTSKANDGFKSCSCNCMQVKLLFTSQKSKSEAYLGFNCTFIVVYIKALFKRLSLIVSLKT